MEVLRFGYRIPFRVIPFLSRVPIPLPSYSPSSIRGMALSAAVADLQEKGAVEPAPSFPGYYSRLFVTRYPQGHRGLATCDRPLTPQPFGASLPFSYGDGSVGSPVSSSGRLDGVAGSPGCLPLGYGAPVISALPAVLRGGFRPAVLGSVLRPLHCSASIHARHGSYLFHHASLKFPDPTLSGRLARSGIHISRDSAGEGLSALALSGAGSSSQPRQELSDSFSDAGLSGDESSHASFEGFSDPQACPEALLNASRVRVLSAAASSSLATASGSDVFNVLHRSGILSSDEVFTAPPQRCQSPPSRFRFGVLG